MNNYRTNFLKLFLYATFLTTISANAVVTPAALVSITSTQASVIEGTTATLKVQRATASATEDLTVYLDYSGTALNGADYFSLPSSVTIPKTKTEVSLLLDSVADDIDPNEVATITILPDYNNPARYTTPVGQNALSLQFIENGQVTDPVVSITQTQNVVIEGEDAFNLVVQRTGDTTDPLDVFLNYSGTAINGVDYYALPPSITIPAGAAFANLSFQTFNDTILEPNETVNIGVKLDKTSPYTISIVAGAILLEVVDDEVVPVVSVLRGGSDVSENSSAPFLKYIVRRTGTTQNNLRVFLATSGKATLGEDYFPILSYVDIPSGSESATLSVELFDDSLVEGKESLIVSAIPSTVTSSVYTVSATNGSQTMYILDDEVPPYISISTVTSSIPESGAVGQFAIERGSKAGVTTTGGVSTTDDLTVFYTVSGTASNGVDYVSLTGNAIIKSGSTTGVINITPIADSTFESDETVIVSLISDPDGSYLLQTPAPATTTNPAVDVSAAMIIQGQTANGGTGSQATTVSAVATDSTASDSGNNTGTIRFTRTGSTLTSLTVKYKLSGSAKNGKDYAKLSGSVTIPAGSLNATVIVRALRVSSNNVVKAVITPVRGAGYGVDSTSATVSIRHRNKVGF